MIDFLKETGFDVKLNHSLSIIMPTKNSETYLGEALQSLCFISDFLAEVLVVDGGSTDSSIEVVNHFSNLLPIRLLIETEKSIGGARNAGLERCVGKFIGFLDSDDVITEEYRVMIEKMLRPGSNLDFIHGRHCHIHDSTHNHAKIIPQQFNPLNYDTDIFASSLINLSTLIVRRSFLRQNSIFFDQSRLGRYGEDWCLIYGLLKHDPCFIKVPQTVSSVRLHDNNHSKNQTQWKMRTRTYLFLKKNIKAETFPNRRKFCTASDNLDTFGFKSVVFLLIYGRCVLGAKVASSISDVKKRVAAYLLIYLVKYFRLPIGHIPSLYSFGQRLRSFGVRS